MNDLIQLLKLNSSVDSRKLLIDKFVIYSILFLR